MGTINLRLIGIRVDVFDQSVSYYFRICSKVLMVPIQDVKPGQAAHSPTCAKMIVSSVIKAYLQQNVRGSSRIVLE